MRSEGRQQPGSKKLYAWLLGLCLLVMISFAFPKITWLGSLGYALIALLLTQLVVIRKRVLSLHDRLYQGLGVVALVTQLLWLFTPLRWHNSGIPLVVSWSVLVGWSVVRLVQRLARETKVTASVLMGAAAGYLLLGLTAGLVTMGLETIQPGSFEPIELAAGASAVDASVLASVGVFSQLNYFAFICLTTVGFGDIQPMLPLARMLSVSTGIAGPIYLAVVMGVLIGRYAATVEREERDPTRRDPSR